MGAGSQRGAHGPRVDFLERSRRFRDSLRLPKLVALAQALAAQATRQSVLGQDELATLLGHQAYEFHQKARLRSETTPKPASNERSREVAVRELVDHALRVAIGVPHFCVVQGRHDKEARALAFDPKGDRLASGGDDRKVRLWDIKRPGAAAAMILTGHDRGVAALAFDPKGRWLASGGDDRTVRLWDLERVRARKLFFATTSAASRSWHSTRWAAGWRLAGTMVRSGSGTASPLSESPPSCTPTFTESGLWRLLRTDGNWLQGACRAR